MFETDCDSLLDYIYNHPPLDFRSISSQVKSIQGQNIEDDILDIALSILINEGHVISGHPTIVPGKENPLIRFTITPKGKHFKATSSYVQQTERNRIEKIQKERELEKMRQEIQLNEFQIKTKGWAFWISAVSLIVSIISLIITLILTKK